MNPAFKSVIRSTLGKVGLDIRRTSDRNPFQPGSATRPIGDINAFLEDVRARGFSPRGIIDIGANGGDWTRLALSIFPEAHTMMIEPQQEMKACLSRFAKGQANCHYVNAGAGRKPGEEVQTIWPDLAGSSFLPEAEEGKLQAGEQRTTVMTTIDKLLTEDYEDFVPDLVKLDVQGFELEVLEGAKTIFGRTELFIVETSLFQFLPRQPMTKDIISFMSDRSYELYDITEFLRRPFDGALGQVDLAFVKTDGVFRSNSEW